MKYCGMLLMLCWIVSVRAQSELVEALEELQRQVGMLNARLDNVLVGDSYDQELQQKRKKLEDELALLEREERELKKEEFTKSVQAGETTLESLSGLFESVKIPAHRGLGEEPGVVVEEEEVELPEPIVEAKVTQPGTGEVTDPFGEKKEFSLE